jgi:hypothetical protein
MGLVEPLLLSCGVFDKDHSVYYLRMMQSYPLTALAVRTGIMVKETVAKLGQRIVCFQSTATFTKCSVGGVIALS